MNGLSDAAPVLAARRAGFAHSFAEKVCLPFLLGSQNADGGWGYGAGTQSRVEPTSWAVLALLKSSTSATAEGARRGLDWLRGAQLPDGSWPAHAGLREGSWATATACLALHREGSSCEAVTRGAARLCEWWPREGTLWWRLRHFLSTNSVVRLNPFLRGWGWVPGTSSWVEPTALALVLLRNLPDSLHPAGANRRIRMAEAMLFDRICPGGGWNSGNPMVYGVAGVPQVGPTAWALLAMQHHADRADIQRSLDWLESAYRECRGAASLALGHMCLCAYGRPAPDPEPELDRCWSANRFLQNVCVAALAALALLPSADFLRWRERPVRP